jgi:hypothetical protein
MMTFDDIAINHVMLGKVANRDAGGQEGQKCPILVPYIGLVARTKQAWSG